MPRCASFAADRGKMPLPHARDARMVAERLSHLPGARDADTGRRRMTVVYEITRLDHRQVLEALADIGFPLPDTWWSRLKTSWLQGLDETGREHAKAPPAAPRCSNPGGIAHPRK